MPKILLVLVALAALSACNTVRGAGQDVSLAGDTITDEAKDAQSGM